MEKLVNALSATERKVFHGKAIGVLSDGEEALLKKEATVDAKAAAYQENRGALDEAFQKWEEARGGIDPDKVYTAWEKQTLERAVSEAKLMYTSKLRRSGGLSPVNHLFAHIDHEAELYRLTKIEEALGLIEQIESDDGA
jgi:hypothetical protein